MPDMPQPAPGAAPAQPAPQGGGDAQQPQGGGFVDALVATDAQLAKITSAIAQNDKIPDEVKQQFAQALQAWRSGLTALEQAAGGDGGGEPDEDDQGGGATTMQQGGAKGAVPMTHQNMRG